MAAEKSEKLPWHLIMEEEKKHGWTSHFNAAVATVSTLSKDPLTKMVGLDLQAHIDMAEHARKLQSGRIGSLSDAAFTDLINKFESQPAWV